MLHELGLSGLAVSIALAFWFLISIPHQFTGRVGKTVRRHNPFGLIPGWTFFAPTPGTSDYRFVFRDVLPEGPSEWNEVEWCRPRSLLDAVWHPRRHRTKLVVDCVSAFLLTVQEMRRLGHPEEPGATPPWIVSVPYLALLNVVVSMPRVSADIRARQFAIVEQQPGRPSETPRLIVCSAPHEV